MHSPVAVQRVPRRYHLRHRGGRGRPHRHLPLVPPPPPQVHPLYCLAQCLQNGLLTTPALQFQAKGIRAGRGEAEPAEQGIRIPKLQEERRVSR